MMTIALTHIRLLVEDIETCKAFYETTLGLGTAEVEVPGIYYEFAAGPACLGLYTRELMQTVAGVAQSAASGDQAVLTFQVDDVDAVCTALRSRGVQLVSEPHNQEAWGLRVAHLRDPEGYLIEINAPLRSG
ncbi:MAG TPA: VOC family protein [Anaerolineales bacterium]|nr:VOC family protein [Anaerolineales bacterium]HRQ92697.1 VOC family protein [Anaerolineales bacterium]